MQDEEPDAACRESATDDSDTDEEALDRAVEKEGDETFAKRYFISYTGKKGEFLRLHKTGGHLTPGTDVKSYLFADDIAREDVHALCKICWKPGDTFCFSGEEKGQDARSPAGSVDSEDELPSTSEDEPRKEEDAARTG